MEIVDRDYGEWEMATVIFEDGVVNFI